MDDLTDRQTDTQTDRQNDRQTLRQTDRQREIPPAISQMQLAGLSCDGLRPSYIVVMS